jgi:hypothetical protein
MMTAKSSSLASAMASAFAAFEAATKDATNPHFRSKYAGLPSVIDAVKPALIANRLFFTQSTHEADGGVCVETHVHHESGESLSFGKLYVPANKQDAQAYGSALTYARRYSLMTAFGIPAEDDDGNAAFSSIPPAKRDTGGVISDAQYTTLVTLGENVGADIQRFCAHFGIEKMTDLRASDYDRAVAMMQKKQARAESSKPGFGDIGDDEIPY